MRNFLSKHLGVSYKTTLISYLLAIMLALQPLLDEHVDLDNRYQLTKYLIRLAFAAGVAAFGKYAADSSQIKNEKNENL